MSTMRRAAAQASALKVSMPTWHKHRRGDSTHRVNRHPPVTHRRHGALRRQVPDSSQGFDAMRLGITLLRTALAAVLGDAERLVGRDTWFGRHLRHSHTQGSSRARTIASSSCRVWRSSTTTIPAPTTTTTRSLSARSRIAVVGRSRAPVSRATAAGSTGTVISETGRPSNRSLTKEIDSYIVIYYDGCMSSTSDDDS
jgi:hypothetical protein